METKLVPHICIDYGAG